MFQFTCTTILPTNVVRFQWLLLLVHPFNGPFSRTTCVSWYQKGKSGLDLNEARDDGVLRYNGTSWNICKQSAPRQTDNHTNTSSLSFTGRMLFLTSNQPCQSTEYKCVSLVFPRLNVKWTKKKNHWQSLCLPGSTTYSKRPNYKPPAQATGCPRWGTGVTSPALPSWPGLNEQFQRQCVVPVQQR